MKKNRSPSIARGDVVPYVVIILQAPQARSPTGPKGALKAHGAAPEIDRGKYHSSKGTLARGLGLGLDPQLVNGTKLRDHAPAPAKDTDRNGDPNRATFNPSGMAPRRR